MQGQRRTFSHLFAIGIILIAHTCVMAQSSYFRSWPAGTAPKEIGKRVAENFLARKLEVEQGKRQYVIYPEVCAWHGAFTVAELTNDRDLKTRRSEERRVGKECRSRRAPRHEKEKKQE